jgi:uncharacterized protein YbjT (DUF2867 family)
MRLAVFGATGRLGQQVLRTAQARGHSVAAHSRSPQKQAEDGIQWVTGAVTSALQGADAVIVAFGPRSPADKPFCAIENSQDSRSHAAMRGGSDPLRDRGDGWTLPCKS